jgi:predicted O-linked N-acetylglucosamine transferase (SPINDLY family)
MTPTRPQHADTAEAWLLQGNLLQNAGRIGEAVASYEHALTLEPNLPQGWNNLAVALRTLRNTERAMDCVNRALALAPTYAKAFNNRGLILLDGNRLGAAVASFRQAVVLEPAFVEALHNLGTALMQQRRFDEAREAFLRVAALDPGFRHVQGNLLRARRSICDWADHDLAVEAVQQSVARGEHADVPMSFLALSGSAQLQLRCARTYADAYHPAIPQHTAPDRRRSRGGDGRIRIAYLSGDFGEHAVTYLLAGVLERHDPGRFDTLALSWDRAGEGSMRRRVEAAFSRFLDITTVSDSDVALLMRSLHVDIAVDLSGHTLGQRTGILARRPAPVQVNYLGLPATMGAPYMDYLIADRFLVPDSDRIHYAEQIVWLPCFQPNDGRRAPTVAGSRTQHGLPETGFVYCSFNDNAKLNPRTFDVWMRLLRAVPGSVLWMLADGPMTADNLRREAARRSVDPERLILASRVSYGEYLARYAHADLFLDSMPFNGGTTVSDALSMGVPVVTCAGESFSARMAGSLLSYLGLEEWVTRTSTDYEAAALRLALEPEHLQRARRTLEDARAASPFFDANRYRHHLESAYQTMWERHAAGLPPTSFAVPG